MSDIEVWLRAAAERHKVRVKHVGDAQLIRFRLSQHGIECSEPITISDGAFCVFFATSPDGMPETRFAQLVTEIPGVELMHEPA